MKIVKLALFLIAIVVGVSIGISNRQAVTLALEPLPYSIELPLFIVMFGCLLIGLIAGGIVVWWRDGQVRRRARRAESRAGKLEKELSNSEPTSTSTSIQPAGSI